MVTVNRTRTCTLYFSDSNDLFLAVILEVTQPGVLRDETVNRPIIWFGCFLLWGCGIQLGVAFCFQSAGLGTMKNTR